jgi:tetratricopeptide (TPR) repeat protein
MMPLVRSRLFVVVAVLVLSTVAPVARAQDEGPWKRSVVEALKAAGEHDYPRAEQAFVKALHEAANFGPRDIRTGSTLNSLGLVYRAEKKYTEAEAAYRRALVIMEAAYGDSIDVGNVNFNIASVMSDEGHQAEALPNLRRALEIYARLLGESSSKTASVLCMEGDAYRLMKRYPEAETALRRCADIREMDTGIESNELADAQYSLALTLVGEGKYSAAEPRLKLVEKIREKTLGITSLLLAQTMENHAAVLKELRRDDEAGKLTAAVAAIRRSQKGK